MTEAPRIFDRELHRRRLDRAAAGFGAAGFLKARAATDLVDRLDLVLQDFPLAADLGARSGAFAQALAERQTRVGTLIETDLSGRMLAGRAGMRVQADEARLPFADGSLDLIISTLALQGVDDLPGALVQARRALRPDGLFMAAMFGGATLTELRQSLLAAETELRGGAGPRVSPFMDASDGPHLLQRAGFALPVSDVDRVRVGYADPLALMRDLRGMGETAVMLERARRPLTRALLARALEVYAARFGRADGRVEATFEIVTLTGWAPAAGQPKPLERGEGFRRAAARPVE